MRWLNKFLGRDLDDASPYRADEQTAPAPTVEGPTPPIRFGSPPERPEPERADAARGPSLETDHRFVAAIGDLHGRSDLLRDLAKFLDVLAQRQPGRMIEVYLGDYVDRGADSRGVIDTLLERKAKTDRDVVCLAGNHEAMLLGALRSDAEFARWIGFGGQTTLKSYGVSLAPRTAREMAFARASFLEAFPAEHAEFLRGLDLSFRYQNFFFAHAGVRPGTPLDQQDERDLLWIREAFMTSSASFGATVVHGHTPVPRPVLRANRISIDTGAYQTGILTCAMITHEGVQFLTSDGERLKFERA